LRIGLSAEEPRPGLGLLFIQHQIDGAVNGVARPGASRDWESNVTILAWIVLGLIAGWLASTIMGAGGYGLIGDIVLGILGAVLGGWLGSQFLGVDVTGINVESIAVAVVGAIILIVLFRALSPGRRSVA
jgi:uncharacterized membrane protein YeaQ/YmgE (transglycosylase-associated protein family)